MARTLVGVMMLVAGSMPAVAQDTRYLDGFIYSEPQVVAEQFTAAMAEADYLRAYFLLSPEAKESFHTAVVSGQAGRMFPGRERFDFPALVGDRDAARDIVEDLSADWSRVFDDMMAGAAVDGALPFSFTGGSVADVVESGGAAEASIEGATTGLRLGLTETEWGEWRVDGIAWDDGPVEPGWTAGPESDPVPATTLQASPRTVLDTLDFSAPEAVIEQFVQAMADEDYFRAYFLLSPQSKLALYDQRRLLPLPMLLPGIDVDDLPGTGLFRPDITRADALAFDTMHDPAVIFDRLLVAADRQGAIPFDLEGATVSSVDAGRGTVTTKTGPGPLTFTLDQMSDGQWRIDQISWEGSNQDAKPWGVGSVSDALSN